MLREKGTDGWRVLDVQKRAFRGKYRGELADVVSEGETNVRVGQAYFVKIAEKDVGVARVGRADSAVGVPGDAG